MEIVVSGSIEICIRRRCNRSPAFFLLYPIIIAKRIRTEETVLEENLDGYMEYKKKVKYKIIPFLWL